MATQLEDTMSECIREQIEEIADLREELAQTKQVVEWYKKRIEELKGGTDGRE